jgi:hypothetical protein
MVAMQHCEASEIQDFILQSYPELFAKYFQDKTAISKGQLTEISYEQFIGNELNTLKAVYETLELSGFENAKSPIQQEIDGYKNYQTNSYDYPSERKKEIYAAWKSVFETLGYSA